MSKKSSELVGKTVKGYKIIKSIGEGKFSEVYRAEN
jgi:serine/threonine protein kinase